jgi:transposase-like protein
MKQYSNDYKLTAVKYYLENDKPMCYVCNKIFKCKYQSLSKWKIRFQKEGKIIRKERNNPKIKITYEIILSYYLLNKMLDYIQQLHYGNYLNL